MTGSFQEGTTTESAVPPTPARIFILSAFLNRVKIWILLPLLLFCSDLFDASGTEVGFLIGVYSGWPAGL